MKNGLYFSWRSAASITPIGNLDVTDGYFGLDDDDLLRLVSTSLSMCLLPQMPEVGAGVVREGCPS